MQAYAASELLVLAEHSQSLCASAAALTAQQGNPSDMSMVAAGRGIEEWDEWREKERERERARAQEREKEREERERGRAREREVRDELGRSVSYLESLTFELADAAVREVVDAALICVSVCVWRSGTGEKSGGSEGEGYVVGDCERVRFLVVSARGFRLVSANGCACVRGNGGC
jgi:hypothetical protein